MKAKCMLNVLFTLLVSILCGARQQKSIALFCLVVFHLTLYCAKFFSGWQLLLFWHTQGNSSND